MKIRHKKGVGLFFVISSILVFVSSFNKIASGDIVRYLWPYLLPIVILFIIGVLFLRTPHAKVEENRVIIYRLTGQEGKSYHLNSPHDLSIENNNIYLKIGDTREKLAIPKWLVDSGDWQALAERIKE